MISMKYIDIPDIFMCLCSQPAVFGHMYIPGKFYSPLVIALTSSILKLHFAFCVFFSDALVELDAACNKIERLPNPEIWECKKLHTLNLKSNLLGGITTKG